MHSFVLDFIMSGLLVAVIVYSVKLSQKIDTLNAIRAEITPLIGNLTTIMNQASANVARLKTLSGDINTSLGQSVPKAQALKDDLSFLVEHGERLAQRLEVKITEGRQSLEVVRAAEKEPVVEREPVDVIKLHPEEPMVDRILDRRWGLMNALKEVR